MNYLLSECGLEIEQEEALKRILLARRKYDDKCDDKYAYYFVTEYVFNKICEWHDNNQPISFEELVEELRKFHEC